VHLIRAKYPVQSPFWCNHRIILLKKKCQNIPSPPQDPPSCGWKSSAALLPWMVLFFFSAPRILSVRRDSFFIPCDCFKYFLFCILDFPPLKFISFNPVICSAYWWVINGSILTSIHDVGLFYTKASRAWRAEGLRRSRWAGVKGPGRRASGRTSKAARAGWCGRLAGGAGAAEAPPRSVAAGVRMYGINTEELLLAHMSACRYEQTGRTKKYREGRNLTCFIITSKSARALRRIKNIWIKFFYSLYL